MARTNLASFTVTPVVVNKNDFSEKITYKALVALSSDDTPIYVATTGAYGLFIPLKDRDDKFTILLRNKATATKTVYIYGGGKELSPSYGATENLSVTLAAGTAGTASDSAITTAPTYSLYAVDVDSAKYAFYDADSVFKGGICILGPDANVEVAVIKKA